VLFSMRLSRLGRDALLGSASAEGWGFVTSGFGAVCSCCLLFFLLKKIIVVFSFRVQI